jgi:hypothetical protein
LVSESSIMMQSQLIKPPGCAACRASADHFDLQIIWRLSQVKMTLTLANFL